MEKAHADLDGQCYWRRDAPKSPGRVLLIHALARLCAARHGYNLERVALTFDEEGSIFVDEPARSQILQAAGWLGETFAGGKIQTYCREFGGGAPQRLPATVWELDEFDRRFATSALDPSKPFEAEVGPTHWIFIDEEGLDRLMRPVEPVPIQLADPDSRRRADDRTAGNHVPAVAGPDRYVRMPELQTRTGLSRSTIYRRIEDGRFPDKVPMEGNVSVWRESELAEWLANPR